MAVAVVLVKLALTDGGEHGFGFVCDFLSKQVLDDSEQKKGLGGGVVILICSKL